MTPQARTGAVATAALLHAVALWALLVHDNRPKTYRTNVVYMELMRQPAHHKSATSVVARTIHSPSLAATLQKHPAATLPTQSALLETSPKQAPITPLAVSSRELDANTPSTANAADNIFSAEPHRLDIDGMRKLAREDEHRRVPTPLQRVQDSQRIRAAADTTTARAIQQAARPDCKNASGESTSFSLIALIPLAYATLTDTGCKW